MTRIGITGHQRLDHEGAWAWVARAFCDVLGGIEPPLVGVTSLAVGADQLFARHVLECGGAVEVVLPFAEYREHLGDGPGRLRRFARASAPCPCAAP